jgi:hypothetical protein
LIDAVKLVFTRDHEDRPGALFSKLLDLPMSRRVWLEPSLDPLALGDISSVGYKVCRKVGGTITLVNQVSLRPQLT